MSALQLELLLRAYCMPVPNQDLPEAQAYSNVMYAEVKAFRDRGIFHAGVTVDTLRRGRNDRALLLTDKGNALARRILDAAADFSREAN